VQGKGIVIALENVTEPDQVLPLIGTEIAIKQHQLKPTEQDEFYWSDLTGLSVINLHDEALGHVDSLVETGAHDVLLVKDKVQKTQRLIPFVMGDIVEEVNLDKGVIRVDWELDY
jgi:16S rRNA processing protein RimM